MPQAIGLLIPTAFGAEITVAGIALTTATGALTFAGYVVSIGGSLLLQALLTPRSRAPGQVAQNVQQTIRQAIGERIVHVGRVRTGGVLVFTRQYNGDLHQVVVHGHEAVDAIEQILLDKKAVTLDGSGNVTTAQYVYSGANKVRIQTRLGAVPETVYSDLTAVCADWDANHRLDGLVSSYARFAGVPAAQFQSVYPNRQPSVEMILRGVPAYDPRSATTAWTENAALHIARYIEDADGLNRPGRVNAARLITAANDCDDAMPLAAGGTEARWRLGMSYSLTEKPAQVLQKMMDCCGGRVSLMPDGTFAVDVGKWRTPTVTLTASDIIDMQEWSDGPGLLDRYNELPFTYIDQSLAFQPVTGEPWANSAQQATDGSVLQAQSILDLSGCPSHAQARRAAKIRQMQDNPTEVFVLRCWPRGLVAMYERYIVLDDPQLLASGYFEVIDYSLQLSGGALESVTYTLNRIDPTAFSWSTDQEGTAQALPPPDGSETISAPAGFTAAPEGRQIAQNSFAAGIGCAWTAPYSSALTPRLEYAVAGSGSWTVVYPDASATSYWIGPLTDGGSYDVRLVWVSPAGDLGAYATDSAVLASAATGAPGAPTGLAVTNLTGGDAQVSVTATTSADLWKTVIYRNSVEIAVFLSGDLGPGETRVFTDACGAGSFSWTARSINVSGVASATDAGPVTRTIT